jgi:tRNA A37 threonylcarbamoyladenosine synthetase subunit TsaC/SUA5/YrdC
MRALAAQLHGQLPAHDHAVLDRVEAADGFRQILDLASAADRAFAADAVALGAAMFYSFGNFCALAAHPARASMERVNQLKGRPRSQVGSVTTVPAHYQDLFDWSQLPAGLTRQCVLDLADDLFQLGPFGFRGPASTHLPEHLTSPDAGVRTTQLIAPGSRCPSTQLISEVLARTGKDYLFITSANVSGHVTGGPEPAHYELRGIQADFAQQDGVVLIGHRDEAAVRATYPQHLPMSTSILAFHNAVHTDGWVTLVLERHGSLDVGDIRAVLRRHSLGLVIGPQARERLPMRQGPASWTAS